MLDKSQLSPKINKNSTLSENEVAKFDRMAKEWWDPKGKFKTALEFNAARLDWILPQIAAHFHRKFVGDVSFSGLTVLDVGSGGGLIAEAVAMRGAQVTGIDASAVSVEVAKQHAKGRDLDLQYLHTLSGDLVEQGLQYDVVINAEVVEHVPDQQQLINECCQLVKPGGLLILATLNRTTRSFVVAIVGAEYVMRYLPRGTHDWRYFVKPVELKGWVRDQGLTFTDSTGMKYNPLFGGWKMTQSHAVNFIQSYAKP
ncbi:bifunctional 2-polyprenyl-6-hydroxyphenol methylase/3-demethylubiquinol 3-O-methyltransferase UbiG [Alteromonas oceanisediminis]|uniref:bifunctional 2-polyprenyl-6-hydroxyphenol methylase/3-demethylubiquinol 3-O-methyltransferase UbiG n=1 Tax=Alteromonas oceanisediminis TaxID=2836180 RepID=UPI001BDB5BE2|nr:bifunctional 2-polyprenyl-6-hydroxyphenol methylase/3-demethylubiquinol 3-O-methyltransferase UbiG [Alteromonas oceanisediminis]MBT0586955.1 bifunctional 2-polyprenyl-6-hydroxyphenol methylase/3-demethylubiquinol 3-O-methyltransferase UbiG [Alteromonas oceanisediminis]